MNVKLREKCLIRVFIPCLLRAELESPLALAAADTVSFNLPPSGLQTAGCSITMQQTCGRAHGKDGVGSRCCGTE